MKFSPRLKKTLVIASAAFGGLLAAAPAQACGENAYLGQVCTVAFNFCPRGTLEANGNLLAISQHTALFSLLGTFYGGDGRTTFALPDLRGRVAVGVGTGPGLSPVTQGERSGQEAVTLAQGNLPSHSHTARGGAAATTANGNTDQPGGNVLARLPRANQYSSATADTTLAAAPVTVDPTGGNQPVSIRNPYLGLKHCVVAAGLYPSRD